VSFNIQKTVFFNLLQKACPVAPVKSSLQILSNIKLSYADNVMEITATDLDHSIKVKGEAQGSEAFEVAVNARRSFDIVREIPEGAISGDIDENVLSLQSEKGFSCKIAGTDVQDFPAFPSIDDAKSFEISITNLKRMVNRSSFAVSKDTSRSSLCGIYWEIENDKSTMAATDGHRLGRCIINENFGIGEKVTAIISPKTLLHLCRIIDDKEERSVKVSISEKYIVFESGDLTIYSKLVEGPYPDYEKVIPKENPKEVHILKTDIIEAVRRVSVLSNQKTHLVKFNITEGQIEIVVLNRDIGGEAREVIPVEYSGENHVMGLNASYLSEIFNIIDTPKVKMLMNTQISACLIFPVYESEDNKVSDDLFLIMPLRIMDEL